MAGGVEVEEVRRVVERLRLRVVGTYRLRLIDIVRRFVLPKWYPCPCRHTPEERATAKVHIVDLSEYGGVLLRPALVAVVMNVPTILAPACLFEAALAMLNDGKEDILERVSVEVWDLGDFGDRLYLAKAAAALLCIVYEGGRYSEVKLSFVEDYLRHKIVEIAQSDRETALKFIDRLSRHVDLEDLANELATITNLGRRAIYNHLNAVLSVEFINELKQLIDRAGRISETFNELRRPTSDVRSVKLGKLLARNAIAKLLGMGSNELEWLLVLSEDDLYALRDVVRKLVESNEVDKARGLVMSVKRLLDEGGVYEAMKLINEWGERVLNSKAGAEDLGDSGAVAVNVHAGTAEEVRGLGKVGGNSEARPVADAEPGTRPGAQVYEEGRPVTVLSIEVPCIDEELCVRLRQFKSAVRGWGGGNYGVLLKPLMEVLRYVAERAGGLPSEGGDDYLAKSLGTILPSLRLPSGGELLRVVEELINAYMERDYRAACVAFNDVMTLITESLPKEVRDVVRVRTIDCGQYPTADVIGELLNHLNNRQH
ncbi:MAG: hypothetical protein ACP5NQ_04640 [Vulcanisaeta sp.]